MLFSCRHYRHQWNTVEQNEWGQWHYRTECLPWERNLKTPETQGKDDFFQLSCVQHFYVPNIKCRQPHVWDAHNYTSYINLLYPKLFRSFPACVDMCGMLLWLTRGTARLSSIAPISFCAVGSLEIIRTWSEPNERSDYGSLFFIYFLSWSYIMTKWIYAHFLPFTVF